MFRLSSFPGWLLLLLLLTACQTTRVVTTNNPEPVKFTILQLNDVYEIAPLEGGKSGGLARVAGLLRQLEQENPNTFAVIAGDFLSPSFMGTLKLDNGERIAGLQMVETLNALGMDFATFGNHEFDLSNAALLEKRMDQCAFTYVSANAHHVVSATETRPLRQRNQAVPAYGRFPVLAGGKTYYVALVGVVLPFNQQDYISYLDVNSSFGQAVAEARREADVVLGLTHLSVAEDEALAAAVPGLPLLMGGHEHQQLSRYVGETAITKADANAKTVYIHRITYYPAQKICRVVSELQPINAQTPEDPATAAVVKSWQDRTGELITQMGYDPEQILTTLKEPLLGTEAVTRSSQTNYGLLTNQAIAAQWPDADVYVFNSGSLRLDDNLSGEVTAYDVLRSFPYGGPVVRLELTGQQLQQLLDTGETTNWGEGGYLQRYLAEKKGGQWLIKDAPLSPTKTYQVVLPQFVADGLEANLGFLKGIPYQTSKAFGPAGQLVKNDIRDLVIAYLKAP
ncbi:MAG: bifunctional metallophosphatase/5'-nucleotidase [Bacteroidetes bacterium]|nr:MAG: bifunctional metallophosphatase/5'-nucleotidase [Bacteroidota bacterium]PTM10480.1 MAG: bifunctional metallophosphatase/5'-nucleotidase [Bacteroidota bacterium]